MTKRGTVDWAACEKEYRTGTLSNRQLAEKFGCTEAAIRDRAKRYEWSRDLSDEVRKATNAKLLREELRRPIGEDAKLADEEVVRQAADVRVSVVQTHRKDIKSLASLTERLRNKADVLLNDISDLKGLSDAVQAVEGLARTTAKLIPLERQAFNLDAAEDPDDDRPQVNIYVPSNGRD